MTKKYTPEDHQKAFELFSKGRDYQYAAKQLGVSFGLVHRWGTPWFVCPWGCPWHNYDKLMYERAKVLNKRITEIESGEMYNSTLESTTLDTIKRDHPVKDHHLLTREIAKIVRGDLERIAHWEYLYGKVFFDLTGLVLNPHVEGMGLQQLPDPEELVYSRGLKLEDAEKAVALLKIIQAEIDKIRNRNAPPEDRDPPDPNQEGALDIGELRRLRQALESTSAANVNVVLTQGFNHQQGREPRVIDVNGSIDE
jgi:hypothetical protein